MADKAEPAPATTHDYIRGGGGVDIDGRRILRVAGSVCLVGLAVLVVITTVSARGQNSRMPRLQQHGVPVTVTVTGCVGIVSGTGSTNTGFSCRGDYTLDGHAYNKVITGTSAQLEEGSTVPAIAVPGDPALLSTADAVAHSPHSSDVYVTPIILFGVLILGVALLGWDTRRHRRTSSV